MALGKHCNIEIKLAGHQSRKVYTSGSVINGVAVISANHDAVITALDISFHGEATIVLRSEDLARTVEHHFLSIKMPSLYGYLPESGVLKAQTTCTIPFNFTVPHRLSINACKHTCSHENVTEKHVRLPPTVGHWSKDDKNPSTTRIQYWIKAILTRKENAATAMNHARQAIVILPGIPEDPPLELPAAENKHGSTRTKNIRDRHFKAPVGSLKATTRQPHAIALTADGCGALGSWALVDFEFVPSRPGIPPPKVHVKSVRIHSTTLYTTTPFSQIPQSSESVRDRAADTFCHSYTHPALHLPQELADWMPHYGEQSRDSNSRNSPGTAPQIASFACGEAKPSARDPGPPTKFTASLRIPFTLRSKRGMLLLPTFHSCFMSRIYMLQLNFSAGAINSGIELAVPLYICVENICDPDVGELPTFESVVAQDEEARYQSLYTESEMETLVRVPWSALPPEYEALEA